MTTRQVRFGTFNEYEQVRSPLCSLQGWSTRVSDTLR
jgi:hypothetical protein